MKYIIFALSFFVFGNIFAGALDSARLFNDPMPDQDVFGAMQTEMDRSLKNLKLESFGPPYFLTYRLVDEQAMVLVASYGAKVSLERDDSRTAYVEARFGDASLDNTDLEFQGWHGGGAQDPMVLRQNLWNLTDSAYKGALAGYLDKKAKRAVELDRDHLQDFTHEKAYVASVPSPTIDVDLNALQRDAEAASAELKKYEFIYDSHLIAYIKKTRRYLLTSEGTQIATPLEREPILIFINAWTRAEDGMMLENQKSWALPSPKEIPDVSVLRQESRKLAEELKLMRESSMQAPFSAPAIMDPEFTGVFFHEALGHKLEGQRQRDPNESQVYKDRVGSRILPEFLSVVDDPTMSEFKGQSLNGYYRFDDEGIPASAVTLVDHGILKGFLMSRWPIKGFDHSNGHGRADKFHHPSGRMANLMVVAHSSVPAAELKKRLMELCRAQGKPYGFWLKGSYGGENPTNRRAAQTLEVRPRIIVRVDAQTGQETLVRGVKMVGTPLVVLNRIVAAGEDMTLANPYSCGAESGSVPVDQIAPSVLVSEVELQRVPEDRSRPHLLPSPFHETH